VDLVTAVREPHRGRPAEVAVTAEDEDAHVGIFLSGLREVDRLYRTCPSGAAAYAPPAPPRRPRP
jgi:hypothetical protein